MEHHHLDGLLVTSPSNYRYFTGIGYGWGPRRNAFVLPIDQAPVILCNGAQEYATRTQTWIDDVRWYNLPYRPERLREILADVGLGHATIGAELSHAYMTSLPGELQGGIPETKLQDATGLLMELRMIKTPWEIQAIREACTRHTRAIDHMFDEITEGMTIREVAWTLAGQHMRQGIGIVRTTMTPYLWNLDGRDRSHLREHLDPDRPLRRGDVFGFDSAATYRGYAADFGGSGTVGPPRAEHVEMWEKLVQVTKRWMEISQPGVKMGEAHRLAVQAIREAGFDPREFGGGYAIHREHYGHGIGLDVVEEPMLAPYEDRVFEPGMVLCIEPELVGRRAEGTEKAMHREEIIVITEKGNERLTTMSWDLHRIQRR
jgi:Xaa-Pro aminopeptidase